MVDYVEWIPLIEINSKTIFVAIATFFAAILASASGTGGGALYMPAYVLLYKGDTHSAVPLSKATIFGLACASLIRNATRRDPITNQCLINTIVAALLEPATLLGAFLGVNLNFVLPSTIIVFFLVVCLLFTSMKTFQKAKNLYYEEKKKLLSNEMNYQRIESCQTPSDTTCNSVEEQQISYENKKPNSDFLQAKLLLSFNDVFKNYSWKTNVLDNSEVQRHTLFDYQSRKIGTFETKDPTRLQDDALIHPSEIVVMQHNNTSHYTYVSNNQLTSFFFIENFLRSKALIFLLCNWAIHWLSLYTFGGPAALICGNLWQKVFSCGLIVFHCFCIVSYIGYLRIYYKRKHHDAMHNALTSYTDYDLMRNPLKLFFYTFCGFIAGIGAGALGIGGGLVKGPLMLYMGLHPLSIISTATFMLLLTSSSTTLSFALAGQLKFNTAIVFGTIAFFGAFVGFGLVDFLINKWKRLSFIYFFLVFVICISTISLIGLTVLSELSLVSIEPTMFNSHPNVCGSFDP